MKSGNLTFLKLSGPLQACNGTALPLPYYVICEERQSNTLATIYQTAIVLYHTFHTVRVLKLRQLCISAILSSVKQRPVTEDTIALMKLAGWPTV
jgi:hypothetical protein